VPLTSESPLSSLHDQSGKKEDFADYVRSIEFGADNKNLRRWTKEDKDLVIEMLSERADGMCADHF
jgi:hypothetical protein